MATLDGWVKKRPKGLARAEVANFLESDTESADQEAPEELFLQPQSEIPASTEPAMFEPEWQDDAEDAEIEPEGSDHAEDAQIEPEGKDNAEDAEKSMDDDTPVPELATKHKGKPSHTFEPKN